MISRSRTTKAPRIGWLPIALALFVSDVGDVRAHDTGHHSDLTRDVLKEAGFGRDAIRSTQVVNFLTDYFSNDFFAAVNPSLAAVQAEVEKLHFDNRGGKLGDYDGVARYWSHLARNTRDAARQAASAGDSVRVLAILGISLHAVQDFYTHSNWVEKHPRVPNAPYRSETWFSDLRQGRIDGLKTGIYPNNPGDVGNSHGSYNDLGMNHDSYVRPRWDEGYVFAFAASVEWIRAFQRWVEEVDKNVWVNVRNLAAPLGLEADFQAMHRLSEWAKGGEHDGHWKGSGSGNLPELMAHGAVFAASPDSPLVQLFKVDRLHERLTTGLYTDQSATAPPAVLRAAMRRELVSVRTEEVHATDDVGLLEPNIDPAGTPDFYASITLADNDYIEATQIDRNPITPAWNSIRFLPSGTVAATMVYRLFDEDGAALGDDDHCDINPAAGVRDLTLTFTLAEGSRSLQSHGAMPDSDRASVSLRLRADSVAPQPALSIAMAVGEGVPNQLLDVKVIQELLNAVPPGQGGPAAPLDVDGLIGPKTKDAIKKFQMAQLGFQDGRVDPNMETLRRLNQF